MLCVCGCGVNYAGGGCCEYSCSFAMASRPFSLVLGNGHAGAEKQALALATSIGLPVAMARRLPSPTLSRLPTRVLNAFTARGWDTVIGLPKCTPPYAAVAISCGRASIPASIALRRSSSGRTLTVHIQRPPCDSMQFDLVVCPTHDYGSHTIPKPSNVLLTKGALHGVDRSALKQARVAWASTFQQLPKPRVALLVGGDVSRRWWQRQLAPTVTPEVMRFLLHSIRTALGSSGSLLVTTSRRTPEKVSEALRSELRRLFKTDSGGLKGRMWSPDDEPNPYLGMMAWADYIITTPDSVSMISEACGASTPLYVWDPLGCAGRFRSFHERMLTSGATRAWGGVLDDPALWKLPAPAVSDTQVVAEYIIKLLAEREKSQPHVK